MEERRRNDLEIQRIREQIARIVSHLESEEGTFIRLLLPIKEQLSRVVSHLESEKGTHIRSLTAIREQLDRVFTALEVVANMDKELYGNGGKTGLVTRVDRVEQLDIKDRLDKHDRWLWIGLGAMAMLQFILKYN